MAAVGDGCFALVEAADVVRMDPPDAPTDRLFVIISGRSARESPRQGGIHDLLERARNQIGTRQGWRI